LIPQTSATGSGSIQEYPATISPGQGQDTPGKWVAGLWENKLAGAPYPEKVRKDFLRWRNITDRQYDGEDYGRWLDSMTYKDYLEKLLKLDPEITRYANPVLAAWVGLGCDVISAYTAMRSRCRDSRVPGPSLTKNSHWHSCPVVAMTDSPVIFIKALIPMLLKEERASGTYRTARCVSLPWTGEGNKVRIRLGSSVVHVNTEDGSTRKERYRHL